MPVKAKKVLTEILFVAIAIGLVLAIWSIAAAAIGTEFILPTIGETFVALGVSLKNPAFWSGLGGTLGRSALAFVISVAVTGVLYFVCTAFYPCSKIIEPIISALRTLPTMALSLILAIWAGGYVAPIIIGVLVTMPYMYTGLKARNASVPTELKEICRICGASRARTFATVWFPHAAAGLPDILASGFSFGVKAVIAAEILMQTANSLGLLMNLAKVYYETAMLIGFVLISVVISVIAEYAIKYVMRAALKKYRD